MATNYENVEKLNELLADGKGALPALQKKVSATEKNIADLLKKLSGIEASIQEKKARAAEEEARRAEEAKAAENAPVVEEAPAPVATKKSKKVEEKPVAPVEEVKLPEIKEEKAEKAVEKPAAPVEEIKEKPVAASRATVSDKKPVTSERTGSYTPRQQGERTYAPRQQGDRPYQSRQQGDKPYQPRQQGDRPARFNDRNNGARSGMGATNTGARPAFNRTPAARPAEMPIASNKPKKDFGAPKKKGFEKTYIEKKPMNKRAMSRQEGLDIADFDEDKTGYRKARFGKKEKKKEVNVIKIEHAVVTTQDIPLKVLSEKLGVTAVEITKRLF